MPGTDKTAIEAKPRSTAWQTALTMLQRPNRHRLWPQH